MLYLLQIIKCKKRQGSNTSPLCYMPITYRYITGNTRLKKVLIITLKKVLNITNSIGFIECMGYHPSLYRSKNLYYFALSVFKYRKGGRNSSHCYYTFLFSFCHIRKSRTTAPVEGRFFYACRFLFPLLNNLTT